MSTEVSEKIVARQSTDENDHRAVRDGEREPAHAEPPRKVLTAAKLRERCLRKLHWVPCPEFGEGCGVYVPTMTSKDRVTFEASIVTERKRTVDGQVKTERFADLELFNERVVVAFACDEHGARLFDDPEDLSALKDLAENPPATAIHRIAERVGELMGWTVADLEDLVGN